MNPHDSKLDTIIRRLFWSNEHRGDLLRRQLRYFGGQDLKAALPKAAPLSQAC
jgi:hypothetical protein